jgi:lipopolysaccharide export system protein LptA
VRQDADGHQSGVMFGAPGKRAFFRQKREGLDEFIEADTIEYDGKTDIVRFVKRAEMRRLGAPRCKTRSRATSSSTTTAPRSTPSRRAARRPAAAAAAAACAPSGAARTSQPGAGRHPAAAFRKHRARRRHEP